MCVHAYYDANKEKLKQMGRENYHENRERVLAYKKIYGRGNRDHRLKMMKKWKAENKEKFIKYSREYQRKNKHKWIEYQKKRYSNKKHNITEKEWLQCKEFFNYECAYCGVAENIHKKQHRQQLHKEHVIYDGRDDIKNCVPSCKSCNGRKHLDSLKKWYNPNNPVYTYERYYKIYQWLRFEVLKVIEKKN